MEDVTEIERVLQELSAESQVVMPIHQTAWAGRFRMVIDRFGTPWMLNCRGSASYGS